jgi:hypothetical protein
MAMPRDPATGLPLIPILAPDVPEDEQTNIFPNGLPTADDPSLTVPTGDPLVEPMPATMPAGAPLVANMNPNATVELPPAMKTLSKAIPTDPFENLSKNQRRALAFMALADAGASIQGREGKNFQTLLGTYTERADMERKRQAAVARQEALKSMLPQALPVGEAGGDMIAQLEARKQAILQQAMLYPEMAPSLKISIDEINTQIERLRKEEFASQDTAMSATTVLNTVKDLSDAIKTNPNITGPIGMILGVLPFTEAGEARLTAKTLKANLAFDALRNIKAGGATLGSVSAPELALLEAKVSSLDFNRGPEAVLASLEEIDRYYKQLVINTYNRADDPSKLDDIFGGRPTWVGGETQELPSYTFENAPIGELVTYVDEETGKQVVVEYLGGKRDEADSWREVEY